MHIFTLDFCISTGPCEAVMFLLRGLINVQNFDIIVQT